MRTDHDIPPEPSLAVIEAFLAGDSTPDEARAVQTWAGATPFGDPLADLVRAVVQSTTPDVDAHAALVALHARLQRSGGTPTSLPATDVPGDDPCRDSHSDTHRNVRSHLRNTTYRDAQGHIHSRLANRESQTHWRSTLARVAPLALIVGLVSLVWIRHTSRVPVAVRRYTTGIGQLATVKLDDGTRVTLAPQSVLRVPAFDARHRVVALNGEAYFDVASVAGAPFVVQTGHVSTRVLGTSFSVRHYTTDGEVRVQVVSGKVAVSALSPRRPSVTLTAGQQGEVTDSSAMSVVVPTAQADAGWRSGRLVFHDAPIPDVLATLTRWYGYEFRLADSTMAQRKLTVTLSTHSSAAALSTLKLLLDVEFTFDGNIVTISSHTGHRPVLRSRGQMDLETANAREVGR